MPGIEEYAAAIDPKSREKIKAKAQDIERLASGKDGKAVEALFAQNSQMLTKALEQGDTAAMKKALEKILNTESGARVVEQLSGLLK